MYKLKSKNTKEFFDKLVYPKQFKGDIYQITFHVVNTCYGMLDGSKSYLAKIISVYSSPGENIGLYLSEVLSEFDPHKQNMFRYNCFTQIEERLSPEDMCFYTSGKKRLVTLKEYKFILQRVTQHVFKSKYHKSVLVNKFFLGSGFEKTYKIKTTKSLYSHKLTHVLQVLQKHGYLHITNNNKSQRVVQIGPNNPFYLIRSVPDVEAQDVNTKTDRMITGLTSENKMLQATIGLMREELTEANMQVDTLDEQIESLQHEKDEEIKQFTTIPDYKVEGSWATYNLKSYGPVRLSLN